ncbi:MAG TPA: PadR family transcriptional regulator [Gemmatimonadales bacterium]|nr:PadR family transcriptional regulator [Gemmatimonadales bacterium]
MAPSSDRLQGSLDLLILRTLQTGPLHGWAIAQRLQILSHDLFQPNQGSLYPALHRLEDRGWIRAEWGTSDRQRRARFYRLTAAGRRQLARERASWEAFVAAVTRVLREA